MILTKPIYLLFLEQAFGLYYLPQFCHKVFPVSNIHTSSHDEVYMFTVNIIIVIIAGSLPFTVYNSINERVMAWVCALGGRARTTRCVNIARLSV